MGAAVVSWWTRLRRLVEPWLAILMLLGMGGSVFFEGLRMAEVPQDEDLVELSGTVRRVVKREGAGRFFISVRFWLEGSDTQLIYEDHKPRYYQARRQLVPGAEIRVHVIKHYFSPEIWHLEIDGQTIANREQIRLPNVVWGWIFIGWGIISIFVGCWIAPKLLLQRRDSAENGD